MDVSCWIQECNEWIKENRNMDRTIFIRITAIVMVLYETMDTTAIDTDLFTQKHVDVLYSDDMTQETYAVFRKAQSRWKLYQTCVGRRVHPTTVIKQFIQYNQIILKKFDCVLLLQMVYGIIQLHQQQMIWLHGRTLERYLAILFMAFSDYYYESSTPDKQIYEHCYEHIWPYFNGFADTLLHLGPLLFYVDNIRELYVNQRTVKWNQFMRQIKDNPKISEFLKHFHCTLL